MDPHQKMYYFDNAATTALAPELLPLLPKLYQETFGNPSSVHAAGRKVKALLEQSRKNIAQQFKCKSNEIFFTSGATEAIHLALYNGIVQNQASVVITTKIEHPAVKQEIESLHSLGNFKLVYLNLLNDGKYDLEHLSSVLAECASEKVFISLIHVHNELGVVNDLVRINQILINYPNVLFHTDTVQGIGHFNYDLKELNRVDYLVCSAHKIHGPKGVGFLFAREETKIKAKHLGGGQERGVRPGTENTQGIVLCAKALETTLVNLTLNEAYIQQLKNHLIQHLQPLSLVQINSGMGEQTGILNISILGNKELSLILFELDLVGICVSGGSACSSGSVGGSKILQEVFGTTLPPAIRISLSRYNTIEEIDYLVNKIIQLTKA